MKIISFIMFLSLAVYPAIQVSASDSLAGNKDFRLTADVGVIAPRGMGKARKRWTALMNYLSNATGWNIKIHPLRPSYVITAVREQRVDYIFANPVQTAIMTQKYGIQNLATLEKKSGKYFAGVIVAKKGSGITTANDLKGKRVISMKHGVAAGAYLFQAFDLFTKGIYVHRDFAKFSQGSKQDTTVMLVKEGKYDAAFIRSGILESMQSKGIISLGDFTVVDAQKNSDVPFLHTTVAYPEWFFSATSGAPPQLTALIKKALLEIDPNHIAVTSAKIKGFVEPLSLDSIIEAMSTIDKVNKGLL